MNKYNNNFITSSVLVRGCLFVIALLCLPVQAEVTHSEFTGSPPPKKVIFFGNSFTYFNNSLHYHLERMVRAVTPKQAFKAHKYRAVTIAGGKLSEHRDVVPSLLGMEPWDAVILQGHSREAVAEDMAGDFAEAASEMVKNSRQVGGVPVLFMTWAYQHKPAMMNEVSKAYSQLGRELGIAVAPVGLAFQRALEQRPDLKLHTSDRVHPTPAGTYLAASVFYAVLYGQSPVGNPYTMWIKPEQAVFLQKVAWETVQNYQQPVILQRFGDKTLL